MTAAPFVPDSGDIIWVDFDPQTGHEQGGHRPAVVLSPASYNGRAGMLVCCPLTTRRKGYPFEVAIGGVPPSVALADQVRCIDWVACKATRKGRATGAEMEELRMRIAALIGV